MKNNVICVFLLMALLFLGACGKSSEESSSSLNLTQSQADAFASQIVDLPNSFISFNNLELSSSGTSFRVSEQWISDSSSSHDLGGTFTSSIGLQITGADSNYLTQEEIQTLGNTGDFDIDDFYSLGIHKLEMYGNTTFSGSDTLIEMSLGKGEESPITFDFYENKDFLMDGAFTLLFSFQSTEGSSSFEYSAGFSDLLISYQFPAGNYKYTSGSISGSMNITGMNMDGSMDFTLTFSESLVTGVVGDKTIIISNN